MSYLQVAVTVTRDQADGVADWLSEHGALSVTVESANDEVMFDEAAPGDPAWRQQVLTALYDESVEPAGLISALNGVTDNQTASLSRIADADWERLWLDQFEPVRVTDQLWICPSWVQPPVADAINLRLDPGLAFGTGTHPTTFLCLEQLSRMQLKGKSVVDYGCGSGILAVAALMLGAEVAFATDVDPRALDATRDNAIKNGVDDRLVCVETEQLDDAMAQWNHRQVADVLVANILAGTLLRLAPELLRLCHDRTAILLSGILEPQVNDVLEVYQDGFQLNTHQRAEWCLLEGSAAQ